MGFRRLDNYSRPTPTHAKNRNSARNRGILEAGKGFSASIECINKNKLLKVRREHSILRSLTSFDRRKFSIPHIILCTPLFTRLRIYLSLRTSANCIED